MYKFLQKGSYATLLQGELNCLKSDLYECKTTHEACKIIDQLAELKALMEAEGLNSLRNEEATVTIEIPADSDGYLLAALEPEHAINAIKEEIPELKDCAFDDWGLGPLTELGLYYINIIHGQAAYTIRLWVVPKA